MGLMNRVRIFIFLLLFLLMDKALAIYRLANRRPKSVGNFFEGIFTSELNFFSIDNVQLWVLLLTGLAMFIVIYLAARRVNIFKYNDNAALIFAALVSIITLFASPISTWVAALGTIGPLLVALVLVVGIIMLIRRLLGFGVNVRLKSPRNRMRFNKIKNLERRLKDLLKKAKKIPHPDEDDYEHFSKGLISDIKEIAHNLARLNRIFRAIARRSDNPKTRKKIAKLFRRIKGLLEGANSKLDSKNVKGAVSSIKKATRLFLKLERIIAKLLKSSEEKTKEEPEVPGEEGEGEVGEKEEVDGEAPETSEEAESEVKEEWLGYKFEVGEIYGYKTNKGDEITVKVINLFPDRDVVQVKDIKGGPLFVVRPQMLYAINEGNIKVIENLKEEYLRIKREADNLPEMDSRRAELERDGLKIYDKLRKLGVEFT